MTSAMALIHQDTRAGQNALNILPLSEMPHREPQE